jgi:hypothetical protein
METVFNARNIRLIQLNLRLVGFLNPDNVFFHILNARFLVLDCFSFFLDLFAHQTRLFNEVSELFAFILLVLSQLVDFALESVVLGKVLIVGVDRLIESRLQRGDFALESVHLGLELLALEGLQLLVFGFVILFDFGEVLLSTEEFPFVLLQPASVVVNLFLHGLSGTLRDDTAVQG